MLRPAVALALSCAAGAHADDARTLLDEASSAAQAVRTATYEARMELTTGGAERVVTGSVTLEKVNYSSMIGGKIAIEGKIYRVSEIEAFKAAYDGNRVRRYAASAGVILQADPGYGGEELLRGEFGPMILNSFLTPFPFTAEKRATSVTDIGTEEVEGRVCRVIEAVMEDYEMKVRWHIDVEDHLPRRQERVFRSAAGNDVRSVLTISDLRVNEEIDPAAFELKAPPDVRVEQMGQRPPQPVEVGDMAPDWTITDAGGKEVSLSDFRGQLVVLDFWATWCPFCRKAMPTIQKIHDTYGDRGVNVIAIDCMERGHPDPVQFVRDQGFDYRVLADPGTTAPRYRVSGLPVFMVIGPDGRVLHRDQGFDEAREARLIGAIERHLDGK